MILALADPVAVIAALDAAAAGRAHTLDGVMSW